MQAPNWTDFLQCSICTNKFNQSDILPITLMCGHTLCTRCLGKLKTRICPYDKAAIRSDAETLPPNPPLLELLGYKWTPPTEASGHVLECDLEHYRLAVSAMIELAKFLQPLAEHGITAAITHLTKPMLKKLVTIINCQVLEGEGQTRALRAARSIGDRTVTELLVMHQNQQQISSLLWTAVRNRGCQFLGPIMQEEALNLILMVLRSGNSLSRKNIVLFVVQRLSSDFPQASKTSVGHVVQLLYRASCFNVEKRDDDSSLMQLKEEFRSYECLRREHDSQIIRMAMEAGLRISPEQWSTLLYGDHKHKSDMQSIIDKLISQGAASSGLNELIVAIGRSQDPYQLSENIVPHLETIFKVQVNPPDKSVESLDWAGFSTGMEALLGTLQGFSTYMQIQSGRFKTGMCPHLVKPGGCPKGEHCTYAHSEEERERFRNLVKPSKPSKPRSGEHFPRSGSLSRLGSVPGGGGASRNSGRYSGDHGPVVKPGGHDIGTPHSSFGSLDLIPSGPSSLHDPRQQSYSEMLHYRHHSGEQVSAAGLRHSGPITAPVLSTNQEYHSVQRGVATMDHTYRATADQVYHKSLQHSEPISYGHHHLSKLDLLRLHHEAVKQTVEASPYGKEAFQPSAGFAGSGPYSQGEWLATNHYSQPTSDPFSLPPDDLIQRGGGGGVLERVQQQQQLLAGMERLEIAPNGLYPHGVGTSSHRPPLYTAVPATTSGSIQTSQAGLTAHTEAITNPTAATTTTTSTPAQAGDLEAEIRQLREQLRDQQETIQQQKEQLHYTVGGAQQQPGGMAHPQPHLPPSSQYLGSGQYGANGLMVGGEELIRATPPLVQPQSFNNLSAQHLQAAAVALAALTAPPPQPHYQTPPTSGHYQQWSTANHATPTGTGYVVQPPSVILHPAARQPPPPPDISDGMLAAYLQVMEQTKAASAAGAPGYQATPTYNPPTQAQYYYHP